MQTPYPGQASQGDGRYIIVGIFIFVLIVVGIIMMVYKPGGIKWGTPKPNATNDSFELRCYDQNGSRLIDVSYQLVDMNGVVRQSGMISDAQEMFSNGVWNMTYTFKVSKPGYYDNSTQCHNIGLDICSAQLAHQASVGVSLAHLQKNKYVFLVDVFNGTVNRPIVCFRWQELYKIDVLNLTFIATPPKLIDRFDACYRYDSDLHDGLYQTYIYVNVSEHPLENSSLEAELYDFCKNNYEQGCIPEANNKVYIVQ